MKPGSILKRKKFFSAPIPVIIILRKHPDFKYDFYAVASGKIYRNTPSQWLMAGYKEVT